MGSVSLANSRLSLVAGTAFADFSAAGTLTPYLNGKLTLTDSAGKKAIGYLKAAGTGETTDTPLWADDCADDSTAGWLASNTAIAFDTDHYTYDPSGVTNSARNSAAKTSVVGALYKFVADVGNGTGSSTTTLLSSYYATGSAINGAVFSTGAGYATKTQYSVAIGTQGYWYIKDSVNFTGNINFKNVSASKVLTPSATGVSVVSTPGGTTYNWASIESGFNYNDASGYTYTIAPATRSFGFGGFALRF